MAIISAITSSGGTVNVFVDSTTAFTVGNSATFAGLTHSGALATLLNGNTYTVNFINPGVFVQFLIPGAPTFPSGSGPDTETGTLTPVVPSVPISLGDCSCSSPTTLGVSPATELYQAFTPVANMNASLTTTEGRYAAVIDFNGGDGLYSRDIETRFCWAITNHLAVRVWQPSIIAQPESTFNRASDWIDGGSQGNKFIQGCVITADTGGLPKTFQLQSADDLSLHSLNEMPAVFPKQTTKGFSCVTPFIAHSARLVSSDGVAAKLFNTTLVTQPWPEQTMLWQCEQTSFGFTGWIHDRECNIAYAGGPITVTLTPDVGAPYTFTLPSSGGPLVQTKQKVTLPAMKFKLLSVAVFSSTPFYLFQNDMELKVKQWGSPGPYQVLKVVGGQSNTGALV